MGRRRVQVPSIYDLKPAFQGLLRPVTRALAGWGVSANQVTLAAAVLSLAEGAAVAAFPRAAWPLLMMAPVLLVRMALNAIDGMLAREYGMQSPLGAILNEIGDVAADCGLYLPLALVHGFPPVLVVLLVVFSFLTELMGVVAVQIGASRNYRGPMGKSDRALVVALLTLTAGAGVPRGRWIPAVLLLAIILLILTLVNRGRSALEERRG
jgi:CDP-diacylglycerol--glycerol-3-phosphate 3-phosphatidyltransferase